MNKVEGKVAIVTGGTQGLGKAIAINFAKGGARGIVILGRNEDRGNEVANSITKELGCKTLFIKTELSNVEDCRQAVATTKKEFSQIDILVNAAEASSILPVIFAYTVEAPPSSSPLNLI